MVKQAILYVGGLDESVTQELLYQAFVTFGALKVVDIPRDFKSGTTKGFAFVEFELAEDAVAALENMDGAELVGKTIRCSVARPSQGAKTAGKALWTAEDFLREEESAKEE